MNALLDSFSICKKAALVGKPVVVIVTDKAKKIVEDKIKDDLKKKLGIPSSDKKD